MPREPLQAPYLGVTDATPFIGQPKGATDPDGMVNMVVRNVDNGRRQLATRPKALAEFVGAAYSGKTNGLGSISRSSGVGSVIAVNPDDDTTGVSVESGTLQGQALVLDPDRTVRLVLKDTRGTAALLHDPPTSAANAGFGAFQCCWHSTDPDIGYFATIAADSTHGDSGGKVVVGLNRFSLATGQITHQSYCVDADSYTATGVNSTYSATPAAGSVDLFSNQILEYFGYLFVAVQRYVYCFRSDTLTYIKRHQIDWCEEVQGIQGVTVGGSHYLLTLVTGLTSTGGGRPVTADLTGSDRFGEFLGGVLKHRITTTTTPGTTVFVRQAMPMGLSSGDAGYEDHRFFRLSEWNLGRPHGCLCYGFAAAAGSDSSVFAYIARTNQGFGYDGNDATMRPDGTAPFISACRACLTRAFETGAPTSMSPAAPTRYGFSSAVGGWERDTASLRRAYPWGAFTFQNDIPLISGGSRDPQVQGNEPTFWAVALDSDRNRVFFAGRRSSLSGTAPTVYAFEADTGTLLWAADTGGTIQQNAICVDPTSGNLLVAMARNTGWTGPDGTSTGASAEVLELNGETGQTVASFDLTNAVDYNAFITAANAAAIGLGSYGIAANSRGQALVALDPYRYSPA